MIKIRLTCVKLSRSCTFIPDVLQNILPKFCLNYVDSSRKGTNRDWELFLCMCPRKWMWRYPWLWRLQAGEMFRSGKYSKRTHFDIRFHSQEWAKVSQAGVGSCLINPHFNPSSPKTLILYGKLRWSDVPKNGFFTSCRLQLEGLIATLGCEDR